MVKEPRHFENVTAKKKYSTSIVADVKAFDQNVLYPHHRDTRLFRPIEIYVLSPVFARFMDRVTAVPGMSGYSPGAGARGRVKLCKSVKCTEYCCYVAGTI